ncbi:MAG: right-handed parallel beta-helix repeat-containing protein, partial [Kiritimatiellales bacterium]
MKKKTAWIGVLLILLIGVGAAVRASCSDVRTNAVTFYVAPDGSDGAAGTAKAPFATLLRARDAVRALKQSQTNDFDVIIRGGRYPFSKTLVFGLEDSAVECQTITYKAAAGEQPVLSGGTVLSGWQRTELPGNIWVADFPSTGKNILTLYCGETRLPRARGKGFTPSKKYDFKNVSGPVTDTIEFPPGALKNYADLKHAEMVVRTSAAWAMNILPLVSVDEVSGIAKTAPCNYSLGRMWGTPETPDDMWVENVLAELDAPGEWVAHPDEAKIYYWPLNDQQPVDVIFPAVTEIIRVEGRTDYGGPVDTPVKGLHFEGLTFMHADRMLTPDQIGGRGLQHGWDYFDSPNAMLRFRGAENCSIKNCRFTAGGDNGIRLDLHAQKITIENSLFDHLGGAAAVFAGYGLGTKDANKNNAFINNHVYRVCELKKDRPALMIWQSGGNRIANNLIHDVPYTAVSVSCRAATTGSGEAWKSRRDS